MEARLGICIGKAILWAVIERYKVLLAAQEAQKDDSLVGAMPRLASIRATVEKLGISQLDIQAAFLKGLLTSDLIPIKPPPRIAEQKISENNIVIWTRREMPERLVDVVVNEEVVF